MSDLVIPAHGRTPLELTPKGWQQVGRMAAALCTVQEIAGYLGVDASTLRKPHLRDRFRAVLERKAAATKLDVRERQLELAKQGNPVGSIWWGKQHLGQADRAEHTGRDGGPIEIAESKSRLAEVLAALRKRRAAAAEDGGE